jgi:hypothetical protein
VATRSAQVGFAAETTYGTYVVPTRFLEATSFPLKYEIERIESAGLRAGTRVQRSAMWAPGTKGVSGSIEFEVPNKQFGLIFKHMLGAVAITTPGGATATRKHSHTLADPTGQSLTIQGGVPDIANVSQPFTFLGCKFTGWELSNDINGFLMCRVDVDGQDSSTAQSLASASYATGVSLFRFDQCSITVGGSSFDATNLSLAGAANLKTDRYFLRTSALKKEPIANQFYELTGTLTGEYENNTAYNRFVNGTLAQVVATWTGAVIEGSFNYKVEITLPACRFDGETPGVEGPELTTQPLPFKVLDDGTNQPIMIDYYTTDTVS